MYSGFFNNLSSQYQTTFEPYVKYNQLATRNFTDLTNLQLQSARTYADIGLAQLNANSQVRDMPSLMTSGSKQLETMTRLSQQMIEDGKKLSTLANDFKAELEKLVAESTPQTK